MTKEPVFPTSTFVDLKSGLQPDIHVAHMMGQAADLHILMQQTGTACLNRMKCRVSGGGFQWNPLPTLSIFNLSVNSNLLL